MTNTKYTPLISNPPEYSTDRREGSPFTRPYPNTLLPHTLSGFFFLVMSPENRECVVRGVFRDVKGLPLVGTISWRGNLLVLLFIYHIAPTVGSLHTSNTNPTPPTHLFASLRD